MYTVLCAFDDREIAQRSITRMIRFGLPRDDIHVQLEASEYALDVGTSDNHRQEPLDAGRRFLSLLVDLFVRPPPPGAQGTYRDAVRRGHTVIVVHVADAEEAYDAAQLMTDSGAFDVEQCRRAGRLKSAG